MTTKSDVTDHANLRMLIDTANGQKLITAKRFYTIVETNPANYRMPKADYLLLALAELQHAQNDVLELIAKDYEEQTK